jgi:dGTPase
MDLTKGSKDLLMQYRQIAESREKNYFHPRASLSKNHSRYCVSEEDHRLPYKRDVDRIIHSKAYARYIDKTQVVYLVENDHITHRNLHVQLVSNFARGIAEILGLNLDLVEAIALGHDVGHSPFGHEGEGYLSKLSEEYANGVFTHPWQSCRLLSFIEPLNLGVAVYDGFLCHDGGIGITKLTPRYGKTWHDHFNDLEKKLADPEFNIVPGTLEGCLVKLCDTMSYLGRDIEDGISIGIISRDQIPKTALGKTNSEILTFLARDMISQSYEKDYISISQQAHEALRLLREFNFKHIYMHPKLKVESIKIERSFRILFEFLLKDYEQKYKKSFIWEEYLVNKSEDYITQSKPARMVVDYISGMTDSFFVRTLEKLVVPKRIEL